MSLTSRSGAHLSVTRDDDVVPGHAPLINIFSANADVINLTPSSAYELGRCLIDAAGDDGYRERLIASGHLAPGARSMHLADAIDQYNEANALDPSDPDYIRPPGTVVSLADAVDLIPEAWADEIADDAAAQGCTLSYTAATSGLRVETLRRVQREFVDRAGEPDWEEMGDGQRLDALFPRHNGIGIWELLDELGITPVYLLRDR
ncbi:hypothetical protein [Gordonia sp. (in: high G+C Gram-positive bacteria)]|uniref:hypothetical protein n=1 Tax=Gordonia sp. (in: high G+C Gram-positive bacteria) TaxID=84139 RepID=UPI003C751DAE